MEETILKVSHLKKSFKQLEVLKDVGFNAMLGEVSTFCGDKQGGVESYLIAAIRL